MFMSLCASDCTISGELLLTGKAAATFQCDLFH